MHNYYSEVQSNQCSSFSESQKENPALQLLFALAFIARQLAQWVQILLVLFFR
jgi:hypothetical protein